MEQIQNINPERILWCCDDRGIAVDQLFADLGISYSKWQNVLDGKPGLTFTQLQKIARFFNRGVLFFLDPGSVDAEQVHSPQFRTLANQKPEISAKIKALIG